MYDNLSWFETNVLIPKFGPSKQKILALPLTTTQSKWMFHNHNSLSLSLSLSLSCPNCITKYIALIHWHTKISHQQWLIGVPQSLGPHDDDELFECRDVFSIFHGEKTSRILRSFNICWIELIAISFPGEHVTYLPLHGPNDHSFLTIISLSYINVKKTPLT